MRLCSPAGVLLALLLAPCAWAHPTMDVGAAEDLTKRRVFLDSKAQFDLAASAGMNVVRITASWRPGLAAPEPGVVDALQTTSTAAALTGVRLMLAVSPELNRQVPLDAASRAEFASFLTGIARAAPGIRDYIIGNEPNLNFFWLPQYNADGTSASPQAYVELLAASYDALKRLDPTMNVIGGAVSPAGTDNPTGLRPSHSPGRFILAMGDAYRTLGRPGPIMDAFAFHPYGARSSTPPSARNPNSTRISLNDYDKLLSFLGQAFDGTAQLGSELPIVYDEYGVQTAIPATKQHLYTQLAAPSAADAVDEATQGSYYRDALALAFCQPNVEAFLLFHTVDETDLRRWQSGLFYPDLTPKTSLGTVRSAIRLARRGVLAECPGLAVPAEPLQITFPSARRRTAASRNWRIVAGCVQDCVYVARLEKLPKGSTTLARRGVLVGGQVQTIRLPARRVATGRYRLTLGLTARLNAGEPLVETSRPFRVG